MKKVRLAPLSSDARVVLIFDAYGILTAMVRSVNAAGNITGLFPQSISHACSGKTISSGGLYFRHLHDGVIIEPHDFGSLLLKDYDKALGEVRQYKTTNKMLRERELILKK